MLDSDTCLAPEAKSWTEPLIKRFGWVPVKNIGLDDYCVERLFRGKAQFLNQPRGGRILMMQAVREGRVNTARIVPAWRGGGDAPTLLILPVVLRPPQGQSEKEVIF